MVRRKPAGQADLGRPLTPAEQAEQRRRIEEARAQAEAERQQRALQAAALAAAVWKAARPVAANHPYLSRKGVRPVASLRELAAAELARRIGYARKPFGADRLIHHGDRGVQYVSIRYTERLAQAGIEPSVGSVGDSYDNALAETINGLYKAELIHRRSWKNLEAVELATLDWVDGFNHRRLLGSIGNIPPAEAEAAYYRQQAALPPAA